MDNSLVTQATATPFLASATSQQQSNRATLNLEKREMSNREIAVRGFVNEKFGKTYGRSLFHYAIYNGTVEIAKPHTKYLIDLFEYARWDKSASTPEQLAWSKELYEADFHNEPEVLASWIKHYNPLTKQKQLVNGLCVYSPLKQQLIIIIHDPEHEVEEEWTLEVKHCSKSGDNKPVFIATNVDLTTL
jgi:hypothetical protein